MRSPVRIWIAAPSRKNHLNPCGSGGFLYFRSFLPLVFLFAAQKGPPAPCGRAGGLCNMEEAGRCGTPRRGKLVDQLVMNCAVDGELGLVLCFGILLLLFLFRRVVVFILIFGLGVLLRVSRIFGSLLLLLLRFEIGSLRVPGECRESAGNFHSQHIGLPPGSPICCDVLIVPCMRTAGPLRPIFQTGTAGIRSPRPPFFHRGRSAGPRC